MDCKLTRAALLWRGILKRAVPQRIMPTPDVSILASSWMDIEWRILGRV